MGYFTCRFSIKGTEEAISFAKDPKLVRSRSVTYGQSRSTALWANP
ncbi:MAG: hypothetical protein F6K49_08205 [Moorea sp. SIO3I6]|nr:hypothetical protein [Moorena sp. SIO3I6]